MVAVVVMDGYGALLRSLLLLQLLAHLLQHFCGVLVVDTQHDQAICAYWPHLVITHGAEQSTHIETHCDW